LKRKVEESVGGPYPLHPPSLNTTMKKIIILFFFFSEK
jgi:hypothetical protein